MAGSCDFGKLLNTTCDKLLYAQQTRKNIKELDDKFAMYFALESWIIGGKGCVHNLFPPSTVFSEGIWEKGW